MHPTLPYLGFGLGLRTDHYQTILDTQPEIDWFEVITENYLVPGGKPLYFLDRIAERYPLVMHGVSLSIGGTHPLDFDYLKQVKQLAKRINAVWISDHLCWTGFNEHNTHDLLPLPYTEETINHVVARIQQVQDFLGRQILLENVSSYVSFKDSELQEWEFISEISQRADCLLLLDVNNVYVSAHNHRFDAHEFIDHIRPGRVQQIHLAGHTNNGDHIVDTHDQDVIDPVWDLYAYAVKKLGEVSTMIERDDNIPPLAALVAELDHARQCAQSSLKKRAVA